MIKMRNKPESEILGVLKEGNELESLVIAKRIGLTYDTKTKYLKRMIEKGIIERKAKGKAYWDGKKHWTYHYSVKEQK